jgi:vacuolar-type H+-ATPase subunit C/Vma6
MTDWSDVVARARGLSGRLLGDQMLRSLAQSRDLTACSALLAAAYVIPAPLERANAMALELGVRRHAGAHLRLLARWAGARSRLLAPLFEDEDRRSIRSMLRGAASRSSPEARLAGLVPTPTLPERALIELSRRGDVATVAALLTVLDSPYGAALAVEASRQHPDLLQLEGALNRTFAARATTASSGADMPMRDYLGALLDVENLWTALALADANVEMTTDLFVEGGRRVSRSIFRAAIAAPTVTERGAVLAALADVPWLQLAMTVAPRREENVLRALIRRQRHLARLFPLGTAPIIAYVLRLRLEVMTVQRVVWSIAMRLPRSAIARFEEMPA